MGISKVILNGVVKVDLTQDTVDETNLLAGETATGADGEAVEGAIASKASTDLTVSGATVTAPAGYYSAAASKSVATTTHPNPTASINSTTGVVTASHTQTTGYVTGGTTTGTLDLTTQAGKTVTPTETEQTAVAAGRYTTGAVKVGAISSTYIGSDIAQNDSDDLTVSGATVTAPAGYYAEAASKAVASGSAGTPTATKGTVSNHSVSVTPSVTNTTGYITGGTKNGTAVSVSASELVSGTLSITSSGTKDVTNYASASVAAGSATTPATTITADPSISINSSGKITATVSTSQNITPTVSAGYVSSGTAGKITVSGSDDLQLTTQAAKTVTPSTSSQTAVASGVYTTGAVTVAAMPSGTAGTPTATKGTVSDHSVTVTPSVTNVTGYITGGTKTGTAVTVSVAELESGTKSITENGTGISVSGYSTVDVDVSGSDDLFAIRDDGKTHAWYYSPSDGTTVSIETSGYIVDWGDGESSYTTSSPKTHMYQKRGIYDIIIEPAPNQSNLYLRFGTESVGSNNLPYVSHLLMVEISEDVLISAAYSFAFVPSLTKVVAPRGYSTSITNPSREFSNCVSLVYVDLPVGLQNVADYMFYENNNLKSIDLPNSITTIGRQSFYRCINLTSITIPENVTRIGDQAFVYCNRIAEYHLKPTTPPTLANTNAFPTLPSNKVIYVPTGSLSAYQTATNWSNFASIMQEE